MEGISGILLTGGKSTRMGTDKASLPFGNGTLLTVQLEKFRALGITDVLISGYGATGRSRTMCPAAVRSAGSPPACRACRTRARS